MKHRKLQITKDLKVMASTSVCRTCYVTSPKELFGLESCLKKYPSKMLLDLLVEVTKINIKLEHSDKLPQHLCCTCSLKLENAYEFVLQAREVNSRMLEYIKEPQADMKPNCDMDLQTEPLMELCTEQLVQVKIEDGTAENVAVEISEPLLEQYVFEQDAQENDNQADGSLDPLTTAEKPRCGPKSDERSKEISSSDELDELPLQQRRTYLKQTVKRKKKFKCDECEKSFSWQRNLNLHKRKHLPKDDWHPCPHCRKKFWRKDALQSHLRSHRHDTSDTFKSAATLSECKQAKTIDVNLCKPHGCKLIQCMICLQKYAKINELRNHLSEHPPIDSFPERSQETLQEMADSFNIDIKDVTENLLIARIRKDLSAGKYDNFYSITNQSGYELSLSSSETESDMDVESNDLKKANSQNCSYTCELCNVKCRRKHQLYEHQRKQHSWHEALHVCGRCDARFVSEQMLLHHYQSQCRNAQKRFICRKCPLRFRWKHNLKMHYREHRKNVQTLECVECGRSYEDKKSFTIHMLTVHTDESKMLPCHWCNRKFYRRDYMLKHLKRHGLKEGDLPLAKALIEATSKPNGVKQIYCKVCNLHFNRISELREHLLIELKLDINRHEHYDSLRNYSIMNELGFELHVDDSETDNEGGTSAQSPYICELCKVQCKRKFELFQHQRSMHRFETLPYSCGKCIFKSVSLDILEHHKRTQCLNIQKQLSCEKCNFKFMWPENLSRHLDLQHPGEMKINTIVDIAHSTNSGTLTTTAIDPAPAILPTPLQCPHCDRTYVQQSRLNNHIRDVHIEGDRKKKEAERKYLCSLCGKESQSAANLVTHMRRHTGEKPFKCDMCEMAFPRHSEMVQHRRKHTGEKPYHCTVCGKDFARSDKLTRHMLTHSGLRPHKCHFCDKCYRQAKDLKLHLLQHTGESPFDCNTCGERFIQSVALEKHRMMRGHFDDMQ